MSESNETRAQENAAPAEAASSQDAPAEAAAAEDCKFG